MSHRLICSEPENPLELLYFIVSPMNSFCMLWRVIYFGITLQYSD
jgi:hypothetical protein